LRRRERLYAGPLGTSFLFGNNYKHQGEEKMLKRQKLVAAFIASAVLGSVFIGERSASATNYNTTSQPVLAMNVGKSPNDGYFFLSSITSLGTCGTGSGLVMFRTKDADKNILSLVTAAFLSGKKIIAFVDDAIKDSLGYCYVQQVNLMP